MRRLAMLVAVCGAAALVAAPAANATFHETRVTEVLTSSAMSTAQQFVELQDPGEPYPSAEGPYWLVVYSATGVPLGSQTLDNATLATDAARGPILISTSAYDAAAGTTGDFALTVSLPTDAGQACFAHMADKEPVHCMTWGTIQNQITDPIAPPTSGAAPGDGLSLQTQCDGTAAVASPTPGAANTEVASACTSPPPGGGGGTGGGGGGTGGGGTGGGGTGGGGPGGTRHTFKGVAIHGTSVRVSSSGVATFAVSCPTGTHGSCTGKLTLRDGRKAVASHSFSVRAGRTAKVKLSLDRTERGKLRRRHQLKLSLALVAHDGTRTAAKPHTVKVTLSVPRQR
jgi:hypothetical protein